MTTIAYAHFTWTGTRWRAGFHDATGAPYTLPATKHGEWPAVTEWDIPWGPDLEPKLIILERRLNVVGLTLAGRDGNDFPIATLPGLPAMQGSEKQVAWAEDIRRATLDAFARRMNTRVAEMACDHEEDGTLARYQLQFAWLRGIAGRHTDAAWWIRNRGRTVNMTIAGEMAGEHPELLPRFFARVARFGMI